MNYDIKPLTECFGAEVVGLDLSKPISDEEFNLLRRNFFEKSVLVIRDQQIGPEDQVAFSRRFGDLLIHVLDQFQLPGQPEILVLSNDKRADGTAVGFEDAGRYWHSDLSYQAVPSLATMLYAHDIPPQGGDTMYVDMYRAFETLPAKTKKKIEGRRAYHSYTRNYERNEGVKGVRPKLTAEQKAKLKDVLHPMVRVVGDTGRKALYVNPGFTYRVEGMDDAAGTDLLQELFEHCLKPELRYTHKWRLYDYVCWDNRSTIHHATLYDDAHRRHMHRTTIKDDRPV